MSRQRAAPGAAEDPGGRSREQRLHRVAGDRRGGRDPAIRAHDVQIGGEALLAEARLEPGDIIAQPRPDEGVEQCRGEPLKLAELRRHLGRGADETVGRLFAHDVARPHLMRRIEVGEQKAYRDRLDPLGAQRARRLAHARLVERHQDIAARRHQPLRHGTAVAPPHQRPILPRYFLADRIMLRALVAPDMDDVAIARGGDHPGHGAVIFEDRVGADRRAVQHVVDRRARCFRARAQLRDPGDDTERGNVRRRRHLVDHDQAGFGIGQNKVGKGAPDIDPDQPHRCLTPPCRRRSRAALADAQPP